MLLVLLAATLSFALNWEYVYSAPSSTINNMLSVVEIPDGKLVFVGYSIDTLWLLETDSLGIVLRNRTFPELQACYAIRADTTIGSIIGITGTADWAMSNAMFALYWPSTDSLICWAYNRYDMYMEGLSIADTPDGGFVFACCARDSTPPSYYIHVIKVSPPDWEPDWELSLPVPDAIWPFGLYCDPSGVTNLVGRGFGGDLFVRINALGDTVLTRNYGSLYYLEDIKPAYGGGYIVCTDLGYVIKIDTTGAVIWERHYSFDNSFKAIVPIPPDKYALTGWTTGGIWSDFLYMLVDSAGNLLDSFTYGTIDTIEQGWGIWPCSNGDVVMAGRVSYSESGYGLGVRREVLDTTGIRENGVLPVSHYISIHPNPFNSSVSIYAPDGAEIEIFDINGRLVEEIPALRGDSAKPSSTDVSGACRWTPDKSLGSGIYLVRAKIGDETVTKRVVYLK